MKMKLFLINAFLGTFVSLQASAKVSEIVLCQNSTAEIYLSITEHGFQIQDLTRPRFIDGDFAGGKLLAVLGKVQFSGNQVLGVGRAGKSAVLTINPRSSKSPAKLPEFCKDGCNPGKLVTSEIANVPTTLSVYCQK